MKFSAGCQRSGIRPALLQPVRSTNQPADRQPFHESKEQRNRPRLSVLECHDLGAFVAVRRSAKP